MSWIPSTLRVLHHSVRRGFLPILFALLFALSGAACRSDDASAPPGEHTRLDDSDDSPIAGTIQGSFAISGTGDATYTLPLVVPPGAVGMQPSLGIAYNSASGDGMLGMGFSLTGLSAITRCARTIAQDGRIRAVHYDQDDALCLDGARLVPVGSKGGVTEYRTFPDSFAKILAFPSTIPGNPADTWKVFTRSGMILEYGGSLGASVMGRKGVIRAWLVERAGDRSGNTIDYEYQNLRAEGEHTLEHAPLRIRYTGNGKVLPSQLVEFSYEPRADSAKRAHFTGGMELQSSQQLAAITMYGPGKSLVREYRFAYTTGAGTGRTLLRNVRECAADGSCKPRTTFAWHGGPARFEPIHMHLSVSRSPLSAPMMLDVTGDGLDDLVVPSVPWGGASHSDIPTTDWVIARNLGPSPFGAKPFFQPYTLGYSEDNDDDKNDPVLQQPDLAVQPDYGTPIDYNHDGRTDILVHNVHGTAFNASTTWSVLLATAEQGFELLDTGIPRPKHLIDGTFRLGNPEASAHLADVNGDGMSDLIQCERDESAGGGDAFSWTLRLWTPEGPGFESKPRAIPALGLFHCAWAMQAVDLDADGRVDLVLPDISSNQQLPQLAHLSLSYDEPSDSWETEAIGTLHPSQGARLFLDVNGDGLPDIVKLDATTGFPVTVLNTGDRLGGRFGEELPGLKDFFAGDFTALWGLATVIDLDGDGRQDVLAPLKDGEGVPSWVVLQSTGTTSAGTLTMVGSGLPFDAELGEQGATIANQLGPRITDADGDGAPDVLLPIAGDFTLFRSLRSSQDVLFSVHDGLNAHDPADAENQPTVRLKYGTVIDKSITEGPTEAGVQDDDDYVSQGPLASGCAYPIRCVVGPRRVVSEYDINNGADQMRRFRVQYRGGRYDRRGRGFLGFQEKITTDLATGSGNIAIYGDPAEVIVGGIKTYPEAGQLREEIRWSFNPRPQDPSRIELSFAEIEHELRPTSGGATYFLMTTVVSQERRQGKWSAKSHPSLHDWLRGEAKGSSSYVGGSKVVTSDYDDYGNVLASATTADGVDLTTAVSEVMFDNDPESWLIGQLKHRKECSSAAGVEQCKTVDRTYYEKTGLIHSETLDAGGDATMHLEVVYGRDAFGNVTSTSADDKLGNKRVSSTLYDANGVFPTQHTNALGHVVTPVFDPGLGVMLSLVDENKLETIWKYDGFGRRIREIRPDSTEMVRTLVRSKDGGPQKNAWNVKVTTTTMGGEESVVEYDSRARPIRWWVRGTQTGEEPPPRLVQEVVFDETGEHVARRSLLAKEGLPTESRHYDEYTYDPLGRLLTHSTPWKAITSYEYEGKDVVVTDPLKKVTTEEHDVLGRLVSVKDPKGGITSYSYGPFGALWTVTDPGLAVTTTLRDAYGRVRKSIDPDKGTTILAYDGFGEIVSSLDAEGRSVTFVYDALGRRTLREDKAGAPNSPVETTTWTWDTAFLGALTAVDAPDGAAIVYSYDDLGRLIGTERSIAGELFDTSATYDKLGRVSTVTYPSAPGLSSFTVKNEYDPYGHLTKVWDPASKSKGQTYFWKLAGTDEADRIATESFGNGFTTTRDYFNERGALKSIRTAKGEDPAIQELSYEYDAKQNLLSRHDALQPENAKEFFQYDELDRLTCTSFSDSPTCPQADRYTYAPNGNLLNKPGISGTYTYDANHPHAVLTAGADSFTYDLAGNQTTRTGAIVSYTAFDMPKTFTPAPGKGGQPVTLDYDGDQRRVRKTAGDDVTVYVGDLYERTANSATGAVEHRYFVHGSERVVAVVSRGGASVSEQKTRYLHVDNLGSVETVTEQTGSKPAEKRSYDAFGARRNPTWGAAPVLFSSVTTQGFAGHEDDEDLGLVNMKGRLYDPKVGRFLTADPIVSHPRFGQSWNPYSYVLNNPLSYVDPSGFEDDPLVSYFPQCSGPGCTGGTIKAGNTTVAWTYTDPTPPPSKPPPPPNVDASKAGLTAAPSDLGKTGNATRPPPEAPADGAGGGSPDPRLSTGGGGADSGESAYGQLTPADHDGFRQNLTEQSHQWGLSVVLMPLKYSAVVGVVAFGLLNPDPAYAPTFETVPEDRPSDLERIGETGLAVAVGAAGIKLGQLEAASQGGPRAYSTAFEAKLRPSSYPGVSRARHYQEANAQLLSAMAASPELASQMRSLGIGLEFTSTGAVPRTPPSGWTWHHELEPGVMRLVPRSQHTPASPFWNVLHPDGRGGWFVWGSGGTNETH